MRTLKLYLKQWICGDPPNDWSGMTSKGEGDSCLINHDGYSCCLGQWSLQLVDPDLKDELREKLQIEETPYPSEITYPYLNSDIELLWKIENDAVAINDNQTSHVTDKIQGLTDLVATIGFELEVVEE